MFFDTVVLSLITLCALIYTVEGNEKSLRGLNQVVQGEYSDADEYPCVPGGFLSNAGSGVPLTSVARKGTKTRAYKSSPPPDVTGPFNGFPATYFDSYRYGIDQGDGKNEFTYLYDQCVESLEYEITLGFAEIDPSMCVEGKRVFDVTVNNSYMARGFDVVKSAGGCNKATFLTKRFSAAGGELYLRFAYSSQSSSNAGPMVSFISIQPIIPDDKRRFLKQCEDHE